MRRRWAVVAIGVIVAGALAYVATAKVMSDRSRDEAANIGRELTVALDALDFSTCPDPPGVAGLCEGELVNDVVDRALDRHSAATVPLVSGHESDQVIRVKVTRGLWHHCVTVTWHLRGRTTAADGCDGL